MLRILSAVFIILISPLVSTYGYSFMHLGEACNGTMICLDASNGAKTTCLNDTDTCGCFHFDQDLIKNDTKNNSDICEIIDGGYCSDMRFGMSGRPFTACKDGSTCIPKALKHYKSDPSEKIGICCKDNESCVEFLENVTLPKLRSPCDYAEYTKDFKSVDKDGFLQVTADYLARYRNLVLKRVREGVPNYLETICYYPTLNAPSGTVPLFTFRCNQNNRCDCGYSQVYESLTDGERMYYNAEGKWVVAEEPRGQMMIYDPKSKECRLPVGSNCTNFRQNTKPSKHFESCSSELKCCRKLFYDDRGDILDDIIGYCAPVCQNFSASLKYSFLPFVITILSAIF